MPEIPQQVGPQTPPGPGTPGADGGAGAGAGAGTGTGAGPGGGPNAAPGAGAGAGGGGGGGGDGGWIPSGWDVVTDIGSGFSDWLYGVTVDLINLYNRGMLTIPAAGSPTDPASWILGAADDPYWLALVGIYATSAAIILPIMWTSGWVGIGFSRGRTRQKRLLKLTYGVIGIVLGFFFLTAYNHFWNEATLLYAPSGEELLSTPGNKAKFAGGLAAIAGIILTGHSGAILLGLIVHGGYVFLTLALVSLWPFSFGFAMSDLPVMSTIGKSSVVATLVLGPLMFAKGAMLRVLFELPMDPGKPETLFTLIVVVVGVAIVFVVIPYYGLKRLVPQTIVGAGVGATRMGETRMNELRDRAPSRSDIYASITGAEADGRSRPKLGQRSGSNTGSELQSRSRSRSTSSSGRKPTASNISYSRVQRQKPRGEDLRSRSRTIGREDGYGDPSWGAGGD